MADKTQHELALELAALGEQLDKVKQEVDPPPPPVVLHFDVTYRVIPIFTLGAT